MPMKIYESSGTFLPADFGLAVGDYVDLICVGGGASGAYAYMDNGESNVSPSVSGGESSFGSFSSASGYVMGQGGGQASQYHEDERKSYYYGGTGAGGYLPGLPVYGGHGVLMLGGTALGLAGSPNIGASPYVNPRGAGNKGATGNEEISMKGIGGNGYGAGGGGRSYGKTSEDASALTKEGVGGDSGKIAFGSAKITGTGAITVTVGAGGINGRDPAMHGAPGVVIVCW